MRIFSLPVVSPFVTVMTSTLILASLTLGREGRVMLRFLLFFRYAMAFHGHPMEDHVASEEAAFGRRLLKTTAVKPVIARPA